MSERRVRRPKKEVVRDKIAKIDIAIKMAENKLVELKEQKTALNNQLKEIEEAESKENIDAIVSKVAMAIKKKKVSIAEVESFLSTPADKKEENEEEKSE